MAGSTETDGSTFFRLGGDEEENADEVNDCQEFVVMCLNASGGNRIGGAFYDAQDAILHLVQVWPQTQFFLVLVRVNFVHTYIPKGTTGIWLVFQHFRKNSSTKNLKVAQNSRKFQPKTQRNGVLALGTFDLGP